MLEIFRISAAGNAEADPKEPIKLLEINADTSATGILPIYLPALPDKGITFPSVIVEITPQESVQLRANALTLPNGWTIGDLIPNPAECPQ